jgi:hypothetical protein
MLIWVSEVGCAQFETPKRKSVPAAGGVALQAGSEENIDTTVVATQPFRPREVLAGWRQWLIVIAVGGTAWLLVGGLVARLYHNARHVPVVKAGISTSQVDPGAVREKPAANVALTRKTEQTPVAEKKPAPAAPTAALAAPQPAANAEPSPVRNEPIAKTPELPSSELSGRAETLDVKNYGTRVDFADDPEAAAKLALKEKKLLFVLHLSGNFEDDKFT